MRVTVKDNKGKVLGVWVVKTKNGLNKKQQKEIAQARKKAGLVEGVDVIKGYYKRHGVK